MKQSLSKQLLMLAILLFASMGSALGANKRVNISVIYGNSQMDDAVEITVNNQTTRSGDESFSFAEGTECQLWISVINEFYSLQSVKVGGSEVNVATFADNGSYNMGNLSNNTDIEIILQMKPLNTITLYVNTSLLNEYNLSTDFTGFVPSEYDNKIEWKIPEGLTFELEFFLKNTRIYHISSLMSGNEDRLPEYRQNNGHITFDNNTEDQEITVVIEKNEDLDLRTITVDRSNFYEEESGRSKISTQFSYLNKDYVKDYTGITEFTGWSQFGDNQEPSVVVDPDGVAITVDNKTGQLWQPQVTVVPFGSLSLKEGGNYKVIVTAKFPSDGTLQINMGNWNTSYQNTVDVVSTGGFQEVEVLFQDYPDDAEGAHVLFQCGDFLGTTIVKKVQVIDLDGGILGGESDRYESYYEENEFYVGKTVRMRLQPSIGWEITGVTIDGTEDATATCIANGYYDFEDDDDHSVSVEFNKLKTYTITTDINVGGVYYNDEWCVTDERLFNEGMPVTLKLNAINEISEWDEILQGFQTKFYRVSSLTIDGDPIDLSTLERIDDGRYGMYKYEFGELTSDHTVAVVREEVPSNTITVISNVENDVYCRLNNGLNDYWDYLYVGDEGAMYPSGTSITMTVPSYNYCWNEQTQEYENYKLTALTINNNVVALESLEKDNDGNYIYPFTLSDDVFVVLTLQRVSYHNVTVIYNNSAYNAYLNGDYCGSWNSYRFEENSDVALTLNLRPGYGLGSLYKVVDESDPDQDVLITDDLSNGYTFENLSEDIVVRVTEVWVGSYDINVWYPDDDVITPATTTTYLESATHEKLRTTYGCFTKGEDVTLYIKTAIGYEVTSVSVNGNEVDVDDFFTYDNETKEYYHVFPNLKNYYGVEITTRKKVHDTNQTVHYRLGKAVGGTLCSEYDLDFSGFDKNKLSAYVASGYDPVTGLIALTRVWYVPAGTGLMLKGEVGDYEIPVTNTQFYYSNMFKGIVVKTFVDIYETDDDGTTYKNYVLKSGLFYELDGDENSKLDAYKAYLRIPAQYVPENTNQARRTIGVVFNDDDTTYINGIQTDNAEDGDYYNLNGQKVQTPQKGIYIKNGKKVIIR